MQLLSTSVGYFSHGCAAPAPCALSKEKKNLGFSHTMGRGLLFCPNLKTTCLIYKDSMATPKKIWKGIKSQCTKKLDIKFEFCV